MIDTLLDIARSAGIAIMEHYGATQSTLKPDDSPLTAADLASHHLILHRLKALFPAALVLSEESDPASFAAESFPEEFWLVDPLDGTKEFLKRSGEFTVNIAFIRHGVPRLGVVHAPAIGLTYWADVGGPAFRQRGAAAPEVIRARTPVPERLAAVASRDHAGPRVDAWLQRHPEAQTLSMGSSLKFCLVAEGAADLYLRDLPTMEWDTAAAHAVLSAAGGTVWTLDGTPLSYGKSGLRNPGFAALVDRQTFADVWSK